MALKIKRCERYSERLRKKFIARARRQLFNGANGLKFRDDGADCGPTAVLSLYPDTSSKVGGCLSFEAVARRLIARGLCWA